ncbi:MAG: mechanosensitive ion channel family protein [Clostridia bacterium]|nr:mechanosensitive ion channel family protein [Clostridia bacterium]
MLTDIIELDFSKVEFNWTVLAKLILMIFSVIAAESLLVFLLSLPNPKHHRTKSIISVLSSLLKYVAAIVILCWGLSIIGVNVATIVASVGIITLIVGFSAESLIADVVTGAFMIFENQYNVGDIIEIDGFRGTVTSIGIRTTSITDAIDNVKIVNNSAITNLINRSNRVSYSIIDIGIPYPTDLEKLEKDIPELMEEIYKKHPDLMNAVPTYFGVQSLADSAVVLRFGVQVEEKDIYRGARILNHDVWLGFRKLGVECPYPQVDVHMDPQQ